MSLDYELELLLVSSLRKVSEDGRIRKTKLALSGWCFRDSFLYAFLISESFAVRARPRASIRN